MKFAKNLIKAIQLSFRKINKRVSEELHNLLYIPIII